jgi:hypothetical protein
VKSTGLRAVLAIVPGVILLNAGCVSSILAFTAAPDGSDIRNPVAVPLFPSRDVALYWADIGVFDPPKPRMPGRKHVVVGHVTVTTEWLWGYPAVPAIEWSLRRGASGLGADAVLVEEYDAAGVCMQAYGLAVKWAPPAQSAPAAAFCTSGIAE